MAKIVNRERLARKLKALAPAVRKGLQKALAKAGEEMTDLAIHLCPVRTGALKNSIDWGFGEPPEGAIIGAGDKSAPVDKSSDLKVSAWAGNERAYYARWVEFGTAPSAKGESRSDPKGRRRTAGRTHPGTKAEPFFYPAYRATKKRAAAAIKAAAVDAIKKSIQQEGAG